MSAELKFETKDFNIELLLNGDSVDVSMNSSGLVVGTFKLNKIDSDEPYWAFRPQLNYQYDSDSLEQLWKICAHLNG